MTQPGESLDPAAGAGRNRYLLGAAVLLATGLWAYGATANVFWQDEFFSLNTALRPLGGTLHQALYFELQPPLYFLILHFWVKMAATPLFGRALSLLFTLGTVLVMNRLGRDLDLRRGIHLGLLAALTPAVVWAGVQTRTYSLQILLVSCTILLFVRLWVQERPARVSSYALYGACCYGALMTGYYAGFVLAGQFLAAWIGARRRRQLLATFGAVTVAFLPWVPTVLTQVATHPVSYVPRQPITTGGDVLVMAGQIMVWAWRSVLQAVLRGPLVNRGLVVAGLTAAVLSVIALRLGARPRRRLGRAEWMLGIVALVPAMALLILHGFDLAFVGVRHWSVVVPGMLALATLVVSRTSRWDVRISGWLLAGVLGLGLVSTLRNLNPVDWRSAGRYIASSRHPGEPVAVFPSHGLGPLGYYLADRSALYGLPAQDSLTSLLPLTSRHELERRIGRLVVPGDDFWLVRGHVDVGPHVGSNYLDDYLEDLPVLERREFSGLTVFHLRLP